MTEMQQLKRMLDETNAAIRLLDGTLKKFRGSVDLEKNADFDRILRETAHIHSVLDFKTDSKLFRQLSGEGEDPIRELGRKRLAHILSAHGNLKRYIEALIRKSENAGKPNAIRRMLPAYAARS
ncbi:MAG: hypothetical protein KBD19_03590 [Candidatus Moranbacteria bacterium]|nr:hypothetical protein [Candidatus Moranbacteria bacterium]